MVVVWVLEEEGGMDELQSSFYHLFACLDGAGRVGKRRSLLM